MTTQRGQPGTGCSEETETMTDTHFSPNTTGKDLLRCSKHADTLAHTLPIFSFSSSTKHSRRRGRDILKTTVYSQEVFELSTGIQGGNENFVSFLHLGRNNAAARVQITKLQRTLLASRLNLSGDRTNHCNKPVTALTAPSDPKPCKA